MLPTLHLDRGLDNVDKRMIPLLPAYWQQSKPYS